jgi:D-3-phosphoglycerate dehydrogenase
MSDTGIETLRKTGHDVLFEPALKEESLKEKLVAYEPETLMVRSTKVTADMMDACPSLELIIRAGAGYDTIDVAHASDRGIFVANCPGKNAVAVAELTMGLILSMDRRIPDNVSMARDGAWNKAGFSKAEGVKGRTLGVIGLGHIGREVVHRAKSFEMQIIAWSRSLTPEAAEDLGVVYARSPLDVAVAADIVTVHVSSTPETRHLVDRTFLEAMKPGAMLINTSRGAIVDEEALLEILEEKELHVAVDVFEGEPAHKKGDFSHPLASNPNVYFTHHIGASTNQAANAIAAEAIRVVQEYAETGDAPNCVNMADHTGATHMLTVRHLDKVGVLAAVLSDMRERQWNVQEMENLVFAGEKAACARIRFSGIPDETTIDHIRSHPDVIAVSLHELE